MIQETATSAFLVIMTFLEISMLSLSLLNVEMAPENFLPFQIHTLALVSFIRVTFKDHIYTCLHMVSRYYLL